MTSAQPSVAILPPLASAPTTIRPGNARAASFTNAGIGQRRGAQDHAGDAGRQPSLDALPCRGCRRPAESGSSIAARIAWIASRIGRLALEGAVQIDAMQPFEIRRRRKLLAWAAGSSLKTVAVSITPRFRRTQRPSFRSMAGKRITASTSENCRAWQAGGLALLGMKLRPHDIVAPDRCRERRRHNRWSPVPPASARAGST